MLLDLLGPPGRCSGCWPHDGRRRRRRRFHFSDFRFGATMELGRSGRPMMMLRRVGAAAMVTARRDLWGQLRHDPIATAG
jgi:hypothetical protein